ncbi:MAG: hypothetical protein LIP11_18360 [Clostridiales bacterium]|nr:hypothetical protein [Clostridiales bacterium]
MTGRDEGTSGGRNDVGAAAVITVPRSRKLFCSLQFWGADSAADTGAVCGDRGGLVPADTDPE